jgi:hypothetical protein
MKVCQIKNAAKILTDEEVSDEKGVNFTEWRNTNYASLSFMTQNGEVIRCRLYEDGRIEPDKL